MAYVMYESIRKVLGRYQHQDDEAAEVLRRLDEALADEELLEAARDKYAVPSSDDIEIDDDALTSATDDGTWVQAWVWMPKENEEDET